MNRRSLLVVLTACAALLGLAIWQFSIGEPGRALDTGGMPGSNDLHPLDEDPLDYQAAEAAPAPRVIENDPRKGGVWLRLVDSRSNRPLVNHRCDLVKVVRSGKHWQMTRLEVQRRTDADAMINLTAGIIVPGITIDLGWEVAFGADRSLLRFVLPLPVGWQPEYGSAAIAASIEALIDTPLARPVDVPVVPAANLRIVARDEWGQPLADAEVKFQVLLNGSPAEEWLAAGKDLPLTAAEEDWPTEITAERRLRLREAVEAVFNDKKCSGGTVSDGNSARTPATHKGTAFVRGLPFVKIGAMGWLPGYGFGEGTIELKSGINELNVFLKPPAMGQLDINVEWIGKALKRTAPEITLVSAAPWGLINPSPDTYSFKWTLPVGENRWRGQIRNVPAGFWRLRVSFSTGDAGSEYFELSPGTIRKITLYAGDAVGATWAPVFRLNNKELLSVSVQVLGHEDEKPSEYVIEFDAEASKSKGLKLGAGTYTVWIPTLKPMTISLSPGQRLVHAYDLALVEVRFSIEEPLAALLSSDGDTDLALLPSDFGKHDAAIVAAFHLAAREKDQDYAHLRPGVVRTWIVPPGRYGWRLKGAGQSLEGHCRIEGADPLSFTFGFATLPGLHLLDIDLTAFEPDKQPELRFADAGLYRGAMNAFRESGGASFTRDAISGQPSVQLLRPADRSRVFAFTALELLCVTATRSVIVAGEAELRVAQFRVRLPGKLVIEPRQLEKPFETTLEFDSVDDEGPAFKYEIAIFHENGTVTRSTGGSVKLPFGTVTLQVSRSFGDVFETATITQPIASHTTVVLPALSYERMATVTLTFTGRGSPDRARDAWWDSPAPFGTWLHALDSTLDGVPRPVLLGEPDRILPEGRLEFTFEDRVLPAGRYKVIPWAGAAEKYCTTFTLVPGETATVVVQGG